MTSRNSVTRRMALGTLAAFAALPILGRQAFALTTDQASALVQRVTSETLKVVNSNASEGQAIAAFGQILGRYGDVPTVARAVLGQPWRSASNAQKQAYIAAFQKYIAKKYGGQFRDYRGSSIDVTRAVDRGNKGVVVSSVVRMPGRSPIQVDWQASDRSGSPKVLDIIIEGISMIQSERTEMRALLEQNRNDLNALIADLNRRS